MLTFLVVFISIFSFNSFVFGSENEIKGDITPDEGFLGNPIDFYSKDKELDASELIEQNNNEIRPTYVPETFNKVIEVPMYMQKTNYWCGPACVEMIIDKYRGSVYNQETYASFMGTTTDGTDITQIARALNNYQGVYHYDIRRVDNFQAMIDKAYYSIRNDAPFIANINTASLYNSGQWAYSTQGHYIVVRSIYYDNNSERFTGHVNDPWKVGKTLKTYQVLYSSK